MIKPPHALVQGISVFISVFILDYFFDPLTSNTVLNFILKSIIIFGTILLAEFLMNRLMSKKSE